MNECPKKLLARIGPKIAPCLFLPAHARTCSERAGPIFQFLLFRGIKGGTAVCSAHSALSTGEYGVFDSMLQAGCVAPLYSCDDGVQNEKSGVCSSGMCVHERAVW